MLTAVAEGRTWIVDVAYIVGMATLAAIGVVAMHRPPRGTPTIDRLDLRR